MTPPTATTVRIVGLFSLARVMIVLALSFTDRFNAGMFIVVLLSVLLYSRREYRFGETNKRGDVHRVSSIREVVFITRF